MSEINTIREILKQNSYPVALIEQKIAEFIAEHDINKHNFARANSKKLVSSEIKQNGYFLLPYLGKPTLRFRRRVFEELRRHNIEVMAAYSTTKVESYFSLKSKVPDLFKSNVVYKFNGSCDKNVSYIGETRRQLFMRIKEHRKDGSGSAVFEHLYNCLQCQENDNLSNRFEILHVGTKFNILQLESLAICKYRPSLNKQLGPNKGTISLRLFS